jgi:glutamate-1-semialdehyde 2,1-aminomutase
MEALEWGGVLHYGTQNASRVGMFAARANLQILSENNGAAFDHMWSLATKLVTGLRDLFAERELAAIVQNVGPMLQIAFTRSPAIHDYREFCALVDRKKYQQFVRALFDHGVYTTPSAVLHSIVSLAHTEEDVSLTLDAARKALSDVEVR